jgi:flagellar biosynthesis GTPase FlhF
MNVKTFQGSSIADALVKVKAELGAGAVILHTRSFKRGGIMGVGAKTVVEITAGVNVNVPARKKAGSASAAAGRRAAEEDAEEGGVAVAEKHPLKVVYAKSRPERPAAAGGAERGGERSERGLSFGPGVNAETRQMAASMVKEPSFELRNEIASLRTLVERLLPGWAGVGGGAGGFAGAAGGVVPAVD